MVGYKKYQEHLVYNKEHKSVFSVGLYGYSTCSYKGNYWNHLALLFCMWALANPKDCSELLPAREVNLQSGSMAKSIRILRIL